MSFLPRARIQTVPASDCYWAVIDADIARGLRGRKRTQALLFAAEPEFPVPIETLKVCFREETSGTVTACAYPHEILQGLARSADVVHPASLPQWIETQHEPESFSLLGDAVISPRQRRAHTVLVASFFLIGLITSGLLAAGFARRASSYERTELAVNAALQDAQDLVLTPAGPNSQPASIRLAALVREVESLSARPEREAVEPATEPLSAVLRSWPEDARLERLSIGKRDIRIDLTLPPEEDPARFISKVESLEGWTLSTPVIRRSKASITLSLGLQRTEGGVR